MEVFPSFVTIAVSLDNAFLASLGHVTPHRDDYCESANH